MTFAGFLIAYFTFDAGVRVASMFVTNTQHLLHPMMWGACADVLLALGCLAWL